MVSIFLIDSYSKNYANLYLFSTFSNILAKKLISPLQKTPKSLERLDSRLFIQLLRLRFDVTLIMAHQLLPSSKSIRAVMSVMVTPPSPLTSASAGAAVISPSR